MARKAATPTTTAVKRPGKPVLSADRSAWAEATLIPASRTRVDCAA